MEEVSTRKLVDGYHKAFIDSSRESDPSFSPSFLSNTRGKKVLTVIERELKGCDNFFFSVAFITEGGVEPFLQTLKETGKSFRCRSKDPTQSHHLSGLQMKVPCHKAAPSAAYSLGRRTAERFETEAVLFHR